MRNKRLEAIYESKYPEKDYIYKEETVVYFPNDEEANGRLRDAVIDSLSREAGKDLIEETTGLNKLILIESVEINEAIGSYMGTHPMKLINMVVKWKAIEKENPPPGIQTKQS